jgi:hypothetical protein
MTLGCSTEKTVLKDCECALMETTRKSICFSLDSAVNTNKKDYAPFIYNEMLIFTSAWNYSDTSREMPAQLYFSKMVESCIKDSYRQCCKTTRPINEGWTCAQKFDMGNDLTKIAQGTITIKGNQAIFAAVGERRGKNAASELYDLYETLIINGKFGNPKRLPEPINLYDSWDSQPSLSENGEILYFVSDRPVPEDKTINRSLNIWYSKRIDNSWTTPQLIEGLNSSGNDETPHCGLDGNFYFSSNRSGRYIIYQLKYNPIDQLPDPSTIIEIDEALGVEINGNGKDVKYPFIDKTNSAILYSEFNGNRSWDIKAVQVNKQPDIQIIVQNYEQYVNINDEPISEPHEMYNVEISMSGKCECGTIPKSGISFIPIDLPPKCRMTVEPIIELSNIDCLRYENIVPQNHHIETGCNDSTIIIKFIKRIKKIEPKQFSLIQSDAPYFVFGWWKPSTKRNIDTLNRQRYVPPDINSIKKVDSVFKYIYEELTTKSGMIAIADTCNQYIKLSIVGYTDSVAFSDRDDYDGENVVVGFDLTGEAHVIKNRDRLKNGKNLWKNGQNGNVRLAKLRAWYTFKTIDEILSQDEHWRNLKVSNRIFYDIEGYGIHPTAKKGKDPESRRIEITVEIGTKNNLASIYSFSYGNNQIAFPDLESKELRSKKLQILNSFAISSTKVKEQEKTAQDGVIIMEESVMNDKTQKCYRYIYDFKNREDSKLFLDLLMLLENDYYHKDFFKIDSAHLGNCYKYRLISPCFKTSNEAYAEAHNVREISTDLSKFIKAKWPVVYDNTLNYVISFGVFSNTVQIDSLIAVAEENGITNQFDIIEMRKDTESKTNFILRYGRYLLKSEAEKEMRQIKKSLPSNLLNIIPLRIIPY